MDSVAPFQPWALKDGDKIVKVERELVDDAKLQRENVNPPKHTLTASHNKESVSSNNSPGPSNILGSSIDHQIESIMDPGKITSMQQIVENTLSQEGRQRVTQLLEAVEALSGAERLLLYLRLPTGIAAHDPLKQPVNPLGSRAELQQTVTWIQTHLEVDPDVSLPKQDVYDEYIAHCMSSNMKPLSTADFGKVMKQVYPSVRPRRLGTRGNSRYCYAGLRKKIKLEVPQLPDLGEPSKEPNLREAEKIICDWAESKLGVKLPTLTDLSHFLLSLKSQAPPARVDSRTPPLSHSLQPSPHLHQTPPQPHQPPPAPSSPHPHQPLLHQHVPADDATNRQLLKHLKRKIQSQAPPGRPKKNKAQEAPGESPPSTSYVTHHPVMKHESEMLSEPTGYGYQPPYLPPALYDVRTPYPPYAAPPRAHPPHPSHPPPVPHPAMSVHDYRADPYVYDPPYAPRDLTVPTDITHNLPINLSSDASLDLSTERSEWQRRRPPEPPPSRLSLPGKKLILETYQSETQASSPRSTQTDLRSTQPVIEEFPRTEYLPKKMRAAEILGGKLAAARQALAGTDIPSTSASPAAESLHSDVPFLEDPKNVTNRSKSTAAALAREEQEAASPTRSVKAPTPKAGRTKLQRSTCSRSKQSSLEREATSKRAGTPDSCCGLDGINIKTGMICEEKHSEILNRERVISICNIDKHDLDDYLNEGNSQEHEEELLQYFQQRTDETETSVEVNTSDDTVNFLEAGLDPQDEHSQGKNEKISQLRELLAKNLKNQNGSSSQSALVEEPSNVPQNMPQGPPISETAVFKSVRTSSNNQELINGQAPINQFEMNVNKHSSSISNQKDTTVPFLNENTSNQAITSAGGSMVFNGDCHNVPQSPTTRTQQYDFVPISDGCHSPGNFHSKSPVGFNQRSHSPSKLTKPTMMCGSLQTSPISHSTAASPFVSPRNTPVPRSRLCPRPIPKHNGKKRRNPLLLGDPCTKPFAMPNEQKFMNKAQICATNVKYCQPMSAPPSPNILNSHYKNQMFQCSPGIPNGNVNINFIAGAHFRENTNGELSQPLSADPLSSEVSQFFQEPMIGYVHDTSYRSQSVPLKQRINVGLLSYNTPAGSVPPTPVPNEFCDFGSLADTCDISRAGLNPETLDKIYDAIDSSNDVLNPNGSQNILSSNDTLSNGCEDLSHQQMLADDLNSLIPDDGELLDRNSEFNQSFADVGTGAGNVDDFLKRAHSIEFDLSELVTDKNKYYTSRSVPSTPLPYKRSAGNLQIDSTRSRELFTTDNYSSIPSSITSKSVPSTPQLAEERSVFNYSNRDFLINGNSLEVCGSGPIHGALVDGNQGLASPLDMLREDIAEPLTPAADLLAELDPTPYGEI